MISVRLMIVGIYVQADKHRYVCYCFLPIFLYLLFVSSSSTSSSSSSSSCFFLFLDFNYNHYYFISIIIIITFIIIIISITFIIIKIAITIVIIIIFISSCISSSSFVIIFEKCFSFYFIEIGNEINCMDFCLDGFNFATAGKDLNVRVYDTQTQQVGEQSQEYCTMANFSVFYFFIFPVCF